jgi:uncharacterized membrane protein YcaP (DUF421 family)
MDWAWLVDFKVPAWELILRGSAMFWLLFLFFRVVLRRDVGAVGVADVLLVVLIADASQNAMTGGYNSVAEGAVLVTTLIAWNLAIDWLSFRFPWAYRLLEPKPLLIIRRGRILQKNLRSQMIALAELRGQLRQHGIERVDEVKAAWLESDGQFSFIKFDGDPAAGAQRKRRPGAA